MVKLDVATLGFFAGLVSIASGLILGVFLLRRSRSVDGGREFVFSVLTYGLGVLMIALRGSVFSEAVGILGGNFLVAISGACLHQGTLRLVGRKPMLWFELLGIVYVMGGFLYFFYGDYSVNARIAVVSSFRIPFLIHGGWLLWKNAPAKLRAGYQILFGLCGLWLIWYSVRTAAVLTSKKEIIDFLALQGFQAFHYLLTGFGNVVIVIALLRILDDRNLQYVLDAHEAWKESERIKNWSRRLLEIAHQAGMAEIAVGAVHNIGNLLTSIGVSHHMVGETIRGSSLPKLHRANGLLKKAEERDVESLSLYYAQVGKCLDEEQEQIRQELGQLAKHLDLAKRTIFELQAYAKGRPLIEEVDLALLVEQALEIDAPQLREAKIQVVRDIERVPALMTQKGKLFHAILNLIKNARESMSAVSGVRELTVRIRVLESRRVELCVRDTGAGFDDETYRNMFSYGFTTKSQGNGFGLHASFNAVSELGGRIEGVSDGVGKGASFSLVLPIRELEEETGFETAHAEARTR